MGREANKKDRVASLESVPLYLKFHLECLSYPLKMDFSWKMKCFGKSNVFECSILIFSSHLLFRFAPDNNPIRSLEISNFQ